MSDNLNTASQWNGVYKNWLNEGMVPVRTAEMQPTHDAILRLIPDAPGTFLDVGCGLGLLLRILRADRPALWVAAVEFAEVAVAQARAVSPGAQIEQRDVRDGLPYDADFFDIAFCGHIVEHLEEPIALLREMVRVTRPGGQVIVNFPHGDTPYELHVHDALTFDVVRGWMEEAGITQIEALPLIEGAPVDNGILHGHA